MKWILIVAAAALSGACCNPSGRNSANAAGGGCFCQRFAAGEQPEFHGRCLARNVRHGGRLDGLHGRQRDFRSRRAQRLACASGRSDSALHFRPGTVSGKGRSGPRAAPGDVVKIAPGVVHWHGAAADSWFAHLAFDVPGEKTSNEWLEPVTDEEYDKLK